MEPGIELEQVWFDEDVIELRIAASNGSFSGETRAYIGINEGSSIADSLAGFPNAPNDTREIDLGDERDGIAGGAARMRFFCSGPSVRAFVDVSIIAESASFDGGQKVRLLVPIEPAAIDTFVNDIRHLPKPGHRARIAAGSDSWCIGTSRPILEKH